MECERGRGHGNCSALARVGGGGVADSPPVPRHRGRWAGDAPESGAEGLRGPAATVERLVELALSPPAGRRRWTTRLLAQEVGLTSGYVSDVLRRNELKPPRVRRGKR